MSDCMNWEVLVRTVKDWNNDVCFSNLVPKIGDGGNKDCDVVYSQDNAFIDCPKLISQLTTGINKEN